MVCLREKQPIRGSIIRWCLFFFEILFTHGHFIKPWARVKVEYKVDMSKCVVIIVKLKAQYLFFFFVNHFIFAALSERLAVFSTLRRVIDSNTS